MKRTVIIAEAGVNHNGSIDLALRMVHEAKRAGADYVKFQTFKAENLVSADAGKAAYQQENCPEMGDSQQQMLKQLELKEEDFALLADECRRIGIGFLSSAFDMDSIEVLDKLDMDYWKIPSGEITDLPYLRAVGRKARKVILSTGMCTLDEVEEAVRVLETAGVSRNDIILLQCNTQYPTPLEDVNLLAMEALKTLGCGGTGYSDHTSGIEVPLAATALGADVIEKHFTLDKNMAGPDHKASSDPAEFSAMCRCIRAVEMSLGSTEKTVSESELPNRAVARKSIVASRPIKKGELLSESNITAKRPGTGLSPMLWDKAIGSTAKKDFLEDEQIEL